MNDKKIRDEYRDKYHDFVSKEIIPIANKTLLDDKQIELSAYNDAGSDIGINTILISLKQSGQKTIEYTSDERYHRAFGDLINDSMHRVKISNQSSFFDFIAVCINKDASDYKNFAITKEDLFKHLRGLIDDKRYVSQRRAAFEPSKLPKMSVWRQSEYYDFVDSKFKKKLCEIEHIGGIPVANTIAITDIDLKQQFVRFRVEGDTKPYVYTSNSKYYKSIIPQSRYGFTPDEAEVNAFEIENNDPYFMFILRCLNKDKKAFESVSRRGRVQYKEFSQQELSTYFDGFISDDKYQNEYDITFVPVEVNPGVDESLKEKYVDFVEKEIKPKIKGMGMVSADDDAVLFSKYAAITDGPSKSSADVIFVPNSKFSSYGKKSGQGVYRVSDNNPNFKFMSECLNRNSTEYKWVKFAPTREEFASETGSSDLPLYLEKLPFNQQCKEDYLNNLSLPGSSSDAVPTMSLPVMHQAVFFTWLAYMLSPVISPVFNYISNKISDASDEKEREKLNGKPSSSITEVEEKQLGKKGITK
ncbi:MAG: hypothetical protein sL5_01150 [Candidatus Mesenet longicola]|uniref:Uncharacterized protein n=1 Tax=Candidatus Mesenet longicola TaxID=1892558 RepID=A0A8J3HTU8_9RICK|nr:MAG: hypothetical protein sGL2_01210 [Candidatus Mesenet longicola]GHM59122.1 MAG: hypothetical protein sL5_01150 [Candidatus Mesenet longicola]